MTPASPPPLDLQALRRAAESAKADQDAKPITFVRATVDWTLLDLARRFPHAILALLDRLEAAEALLAALQERVEALEAALLPFAAAARDIDDGTPEDMRCEDDYAIGDASAEVVTVGHCRRAAALLREGEGG